MFQSTRGERESSVDDYCLSSLTSFCSAFWGQSFVGELTRISAQAEKKTKVRRESLVKYESQSNGVDGTDQGTKDTTGNGA